MIGNKFSTSQRLLFTESCVDELLVLAKKKHSFVHKKSKGILTVSAKYITRKKVQFAFEEN